MKLYGTMILDARDRKGLTQAGLAKALKISVPTIARAESGSDIHPTTGKLICEFLGVNLARAVVPRSEENGDAA